MYLNAVIFINTDELKNRDEFSPKNNRAELFRSLNHNS